MTSPRVVTLTLHPAIDRVVRIGQMISGATFDGRLELAIPAGKGVNTARSLRSICNPKQRVFAAVWGGGAEAEFFVSRLGEANIECEVCPRPCPTRHAHTFLEANGRETHIKESMPNPSAREQSALLAFLTKTIRANDIVAVCGSAPFGILKNTLVQVFEIARKKSSFVIADTNGSALDIAGISGIDCLKGNAAEIGGWLSSRTATARERLFSFQHKNPAHIKLLRESFSKRHAPRQIVITLGADGIVVASAERILHCRLREKINACEIVSTTGCGDAATAGLIWSLLEDKTDISSMASIATACGAAKLFFADPGKLSLKLVNRFVRYCSITNIE